MTKPEKESKYPPEANITALAAIAVCAIPIYLFQRGARAERGVRSRLLPHSSITTTRPASSGATCSRKAARDSGSCSVALSDLFCASSPDDGGVGMGLQLGPQQRILLRRDGRWPAGGDSGGERAALALATQPAADGRFAHLKGGRQRGAGHPGLGSGHDTFTQINAVGSHLPSLPARSTYATVALGATDTIRCTWNCVDAATSPTKSATSSSQGSAPHQAGGRANDARDGEARVSAVQAPAGRWRCA
jgi:hypothetical protein